MEKKSKEMNMKRRIRLTEGDLRRIVNRSVRKVLREVTTMSGEEMQDMWREQGNTYNEVYPTRNGVDLYTLSNGKKPLYFGSKAEAMQWIKEYVTDPKTAEMLMSALANYRKFGGRIHAFNGAPSPM